MDIIDWSRLATFADEDDPEDMEWLEEMLSTLIGNTATRLQELRQLIEDKNGAELKPLLHQIKGVAANFGLTKLQEVSAHAETLLKNGELDESIKESLTLQSIWEETQKELIEKYKLQIPQ
ncbi:MAG: Hpt domain-containing protein [Leptospiraceae bacterium]|nr:Hpt domain-containing protein [Leptospiraceae bacterium]MCP5496557.1 Hpt domain-containing protein [Leptospiraceae bacterium]